MDSDLVNISDVDVDIGGTEQPDPQQSVEGPQRARRRTITSSWTGRRLRSPTTEAQRKHHPPELMLFPTNSAQYEGREQLLGKPNHLNPLLGIPEHSATLRATACVSFSC